MLLLHSTQQLPLPPGHAGGPCSGDGNGDRDGTGLLLLLPRGLLHPGPWHSPARDPWHTASRLSPARLPLHSLPMGHVAQPGAGGTWPGCGAGGEGALAVPVSGKGLGESRSGSAAAAGQGQGVAEVSV